MGLAAEVDVGAVGKAEVAVDSSSVDVEVVVEEAEVDVEVVVEEAEVDVEVEVEVCVEEAWVVVFMVVDCGAEVVETLLALAVAGSCWCSSSSWCPPSDSWCPFPEL